MVLRFLGVVGVLITLIIVVLHKNGQTWVAAEVYGGLGALVIGGVIYYLLVRRLFRRRLI